MMTRPRDLKRRYNLTVEQKVAMLEHQKHRCPICQGNNPNNIDHDHKKIKNATREILCNSCNSGLGFFKDDPSILLRAARYILKHRGWSVEKHVRPL
jgi:hypothetical protein